MAVRDRFPGGEVTSLFFNYSEGSNEGIIGKEAEMRGSMVKCEERPLERPRDGGGGMCNSSEVPHELWCYENCEIHVG